MNLFLRESQLSDGLNYFLLSLLFLGIIFLIIVIWMYAKWLTVGPSLKRKRKNFLNKISGNKMEAGVSVKKGEVQVEISYLDQLNKQMESTNNPQELLELQNKIDIHKKQVVEAEKKIKLEEEKKLAKIEKKLETQRIKEEMKIKSKEYKNKSKKEKQKNKENK